MKVSNKKTIYLFVLILIIMSVFREKIIKISYLSAIAYIMNFIIYASLLLLWIISIYKRVMHKNIRRYLMFIGFLLIFWLFLRTCRHRIFLGHPEIQIFLWYCYYIPITLGPLICYYIALTIGNKEGYEIGAKYKSLIIAELILVTSILTNSSHQLAFILPMASVYFPGKGHGYGIIYYMVVIWSLTLLFMTMYVIFKKCRVKEKKQYIIQPFVIINMTIIYTIFYNFNPLHRALRFLDITLVYSVAIIAFWESCIQSGLIPSNSKYNKFFKNSALDAVIIDKNGDIHYYSKNQTLVDKEIFEIIKKQKNLKINETTQLHSYPVNGGYVVWVEELSSILKLIQELKNVNSELQDEVVLIQSEIQTQAMIIKYKEKTRLYDIIKHHTEPQILKIKEILTQIQNDSENTKLWYQINVLATYIKRCINLILISQSDEKITIDFDIAIRETFEKLKQSNIDSTIKNEIKGNISIKQALQIYHIIQYIIEITFLQLKDFFVIIKKEDENFNIHLIIDGDDIQDLIKKYLGNIISRYEMDYEENTVYLNINSSDYSIEMGGKI